MRGAAAIALVAVLAACTGGDDPLVAKTVTLVPDLTGYNTVPLTAASKDPRDAPAGTFNYLIVDHAIDWYVFATNLQPDRAYRVLLTAADGKEYAVASRRTAADGTLGAHGVETALMNRQCVGSEDPSRRTLESARSLRISVKSDGSSRGATGNDMLGSRSAMPCGGNGDGVFEYVLTSADSVMLDR
jgi:hypothetical protein